MYNPETLATLDTQDEDPPKNQKKNPHKTEN